MDNLAIVTAHTPGCIDTATRLDLGQFALENGRGISHHGVPSISGMSS